MRSPYGKTQFIQALACVALISLTGCLQGDITWVGTSSTQIPAMVKLTGIPASMRTGAPYTFRAELLDTDGAEIQVYEGKMSFELGGASVSLDYAISDQGKIFGVFSPTTIGSLTASNPSGISKVFVSNSATVESPVCGSGSGSGGYKVAYESGTFTGGTPSLNIDMDVREDLPMYIGQSILASCFKLDAGKSITSPTGSGGIYLTGDQLDIDGTINVGAPGFILRIGSTSTPGNQVFKMNSANMPTLGNLAIDNGKTVLLDGAGATLAADSLTFTGIRNTLLINTALKVQQPITIPYGYTVVVLPGASLSAAHGLTVSSGGTLKVLGQRSESGSSGGLLLADGTQLTVATGANLVIHGTPGNRARIDDLPGVQMSGISLAISGQLWLNHGNIGHLGPAGVNLYNNSPEAEADNAVISNASFDMITSGTALTLPSALGLGYLFNLSFSGPISPLFIDAKALSSLVIASRVGSQAATLSVLEADPSHPKILFVSDTQWSLSGGFTSEPPVDAATEALVD